jgi:hypothetical protein
MLILYCCYCCFSLFLSKSGTWNKLADSLTRELVLFVVLTLRRKEWNKYINIVALRPRCLRTRFDSRPPVRRCRSSGRIAADCETCFCCVVAYDKYSIRFYLDHNTVNKNEFYNVSMVCGCWAPHANLPAEIQELHAAPIMLAIPKMHCRTKKICVPSAIHVLIKTTYTTFRPI